MMDPSFSICIPNYNYGRYIGETIQSVLDQTYQNFEIIVVDNASTDNSVEVIESFKDDRIRLIRNRYNVGFAPNLQRATMFARNDFVNLLSSDDQMKSNALECYAEVLVRLGDDARRAVLYSDAEGFTDQGEITSLIRKAEDGFYNEHLPPDAYKLASSNGSVPYRLFSGREVLKDSLGSLKTFAPFLSLVYARALWESIEGYNAVRTIGPDKYFNYKLLSLDPVVAYLPLVLYRYRVYESDNRAAQTRTLKQPIDDYLYTIEYSAEYLQKLGLSREQLINAFLDRICLKEGLSQLGRRNYAHAFRLFAFAMASHPGAALRLPKTYALGALLALGPLALIVAPALYGAYKSVRD